MRAPAPSRPARAAAGTRPVGDPMTGNTSYTSAYRAASIALNFATFI